MRVSLLMLLSCTEVFRGASCQRRIVGGTKAEDGMFPYAVSVLVKGMGSCTGSILSDSWVLTAAHCMPTNPYSRIRIAAGSANKWSSKVQLRYCDEFKVHDRYRKNMLAGYDIALVKIDPPFNMSSPDIGNVSLSSYKWPKMKLSCIALGWGRLSDSGVSPDVLQYLEVTAKHGIYGCPCVGRLEEKKLVCLEGVDDEGPCRGDSGGPLVCDGKVVGVAHMGFNKRGCSRVYPAPPKVSCGNKDTVVTYMYVCPQLDWIRKHVPGVPATPPSCSAVVNKSYFHCINVLNQCLLFMFFYTINIYNIYYLSISPI